MTTRAEWMAEIDKYEARLASWAREETIWVERETALNKEIELLRKEKHDALQASRDNVAWFETLKADFDTLHEALVKIASWADSSDTTPCEVIASRALETLK